MATYLLDINESSHWIINDSDDQGAAGALGNLLSVLKIFLR